MQVTERKKYIDYIKAFGIILVVLGHINYANGMLKAWIYAFHMPVFFFAAGLTFKPCRSVSLELEQKFLLKRIRSLLVPYFLWGFLYAGYSHQNLINILYGSYGSINRAGSLSSLWFLPTMFLAVCGLEIIRVTAYKKRNPKIIYSMVMVLGVSLSLCMTSMHDSYPWCLNVAVLALGYMIAGYLFDTAVNIVEIRSKKYFSAFLIALGVLGFLGTLSYRMNDQDSIGYVLMARMRIGNPVNFLFVALAGCIMIYGSARLLDTSGREFKLLLFLGQNSLGIFAVHKPVITVFDILCDRVSLDTYAELIVSFAGVLAISCVACVMINYFAPCLVGKGNAAKK